MDLKNYLLEYVSSGRRRKKNIPVEPDKVLNDGDVVRIKDKEWLETLRSDTTGWRYIDYPGVKTISFTPVMANYLGREVMVVKSMVDNSGWVRYKVRLTDGNSRDNNIIGNFVFTNEMLEYI